jgi:uncharacterized protein (DUF427 family)
MRPPLGPNQTLAVVPSAKRLRVFLGDRAVADSVNCQLLFEAGRQPAIYFPPADVAMALLRPSDHATHCPDKGAARYWTVEAGGRTATDAAWSYPAPGPQAAAIAGHIAFVWDRMDRWMEEDSPLLGHARNPFTRIDTLPSTRLVTVKARGRTLAETRRAVLLYETGHPCRPYIAREDVAMDLLRPSATRTVCPYKGVAHYYSAVIDGREIKDVAWCYAEPMPEVTLIRDRLAFYPERVDELAIAPR